FPRSASSGPVLPQPPPPPATSAAGGCLECSIESAQQQQQQQQQPMLRNRHRLAGGVSPASSDRVASSCLPIGAGYGGSGGGGSFRMEASASGGSGIEAHSYRPSHLAVPGEPLEFGMLRSAQSHESLIGPSPHHQQQQQQLQPHPSSFSDRLKKVNRPDLENTRHRDNSLKLWIFEAKRLPPKKRYFCEICLDHILYARTTTKEKTADSDPFWGEPFEFSNLQDIALVTVKLFREADKKKKKDKNQLIGEVRLPVHDIGSAIEQWHSLAAPQQPQQQQPQPQPQPQLPQQPCIRLRSHYISIDVLPLQCYRGLHRCLMQQAEPLVAALEPRLNLRDKEELAARLISVAHADGGAQELLTGLVMQELSASANDLLVFRGNSIATKAVEFFLRLVGSDYLRRVLTEPLSILLRDDPQCEVDPQRVDAPDTLAANQRRLREFVDLFWTRVQASTPAVPPEIGRLFALIRQRLAESRRPELGDTLVSASLFLRLLCPAILGPTLFGSPRSCRASGPRNLANGTLYGAKEAYMQFMNRFLEERTTEMRLFLKAASRPSQLPDAPPGIDLGCELAQLHLLLSATCSDQQQQQLQEPCLAALSSHLATLTHCLRHGGYLAPAATPGSSSLTAATSFAAASPVQFFNPTYQKGCLPPLYSQSRRSSDSSEVDNDDRQRRLADDDYEGGEEDDDEDPLDSPPRERRLGGRGSSSSEMASSEASSLGRSQRHQFAPQRREVASQASQAAASKIRPLVGWPSPRRGDAAEDPVAGPGAGLDFNNFGVGGAGGGSDDSLMLQQQQQQQQQQRVRMGL
uniref:Ras-GAP domain-containing protein n=1 Tax=Macrostomum lignano TaxID=282301 RepID=A0A1I8IA29_9PLAT